MKTTLPSKFFCVLTGLFVALTPLRSVAASYEIPVFSGFYLIANQLEKGGNTLNEVLTTNAPFGSRLYKWDTTNQNYFSASCRFPRANGFPTAL